MVALFTHTAISSRWSLRRSIHTSPRDDGIRAEGLLFS